MGVTLFFNTDKIKTKSQQAKSVFLAVSAGLLGAGWLVSFPIAFLLRLRSQIKFLLIQIYAKYS